MSLDNTEISRFIKLQRPSELHPHVRAPIVSKTSSDVATPPGSSDSSPSASEPDLHPTLTAYRGTPCLPA